MSIGICCVAIIGFHGGVFFIGFMGSHRLLERFHRVLYTEFIGV